MRGQGFVREVLAGRNGEQGRSEPTTICRLGSPYGPYRSIEAGPKRCTVGVPTRDRQIEGPAVGGPITAVAISSRAASEPSEGRACQVQRRLVHQ